MSEKDKKPPMQEKPFHDGYTKSGKLSRLRKLGIISLSTSVAAMAVILIISLISARSGSGFIIDLNRVETATHFTMGLSPRKGGGETPAGSSVLVGEPLGNANPVAHKAVREYYNAKFAEVGYENDFSGSWNYADPKTGEPLAMLFTFYLNNISETEEQPYRIAARLNSELAYGGDGRRPYDYVRLALFEGDYGQKDDSVRYYAARNTNGWGTENDPQDTRECLSKTLAFWNYDENRDYRVPDYYDTFNGQKIEFCESFDSGADGLGLFVSDGVIKPGAARRITFVCYLEGDDPDCINVPPQKQKLGFSLHIGV